MTYRITDKPNPNLELGVAKFKRTAGRQGHEELECYRKGYVFNGVLHPGYDQVEELDENGNFVRIHLAEYCEQM